MLPHTWILSLKNRHLHNPQGQCIAILILICHKWEDCHLQLLYLDSCDQTNIFKKTPKKIMFQITLLIVYVTTYVGYEQTTKIAVKLKICTRRKKMRFLTH